MNPFVSCFHRPAARAALICVAALVFPGFGALFAEPPPAIGAEQPWTTVEAEEMKTSRVVLGPKYGPHQLETEASRQRAVRLAVAGDYVEFLAPVSADALVIRYSVPDAERGGGLASALEISVNGHRVHTLPLTSRYSHLYGDYPFTNNPAAGKARNFFDEARVKGLIIRSGDVVRLERPATAGVECVIDLVDLEAVPAPLTAPAQALSVLDYGAKGDGRADDTAALQAAVAAASRQGGGVVWVPAGDYQIAGDIIVTSGVTIQGAGLWHTTFVGDEARYGDAAHRVRFKLIGQGMHLADFAILGRLNYRNDNEPNDGVVGAGCADASIRRLWIEHTKVGVWIYNGSNLQIEGCRFRDLLADGVNLCVGTRASVVENCSARGAGDDCFAIWPAPSDQGFIERYRPGENIIRRCTGQLPFLANGAAVYGGANNRVEDCLFTDITAGCGILISSTFPTSDEAGKIDNNFSGTTVVARNRLERCGGSDHSWGWRGSVQICMDRRSIAGLAIEALEIRDSISDGLTVVGPGSAKGQGTLSEARVEGLTIGRVGLGDPTRHRIWIRADARGGLTFAGTDLLGLQNDSASFAVAAAKK